MIRNVTLAGYALLALLLLLTQLAARRTVRIPTAGEIVSALLGRWWLRLLALTAWLWVGVHVFVRSTPGG